MTLVKFNQRPFDKTLNHFVDEIFNQVPGWSNGNASVPVNITETKDDFRMEVVAPGFNKDSFNINLDQQLLTLSAEQKEVSEKAEGKQVRKEYAYKSFKRVFNLDDSIDGEKISASYENGVLHVILPKKEEVKKTPTQISVQ